MEKNLKVAGYNCPSILYKAKGTPVVLLHGFSYTNEIWQRIGLTDMLIEKRIPFLALDMPYGLKSRCQPKTRDVQTNLTVVSEAIKNVFGETVPVLVGASLGGNMALNYAAKFPVKGLLVVAPSLAFEQPLLDAYKGFNFPVRIVWGSYDSIISGEEMRTLAEKLPHGKLLVYEGAAHSAYQDKPEWFNRDLLELYAMAE